MTPSIRITVELGEFPYGDAPILEFSDMAQVTMGSKGQLLDDNARKEIHANIDSILSRWKLMS